MFDEDDDDDDENRYHAVQVHLGLICLIFLTHISYTTISYRVTWVVVTPNNDANGEDGTIQAGEYAKGDTATLFVYTDPGHVDNLHSQPKELFEKALMRSIGQKGTIVIDMRICCVLI